MYKKLLYIALFLLFINDNKAGAHTQMIDQSLNQDAPLIDINFKPEQNIFPKINFYNQSGEVQNIANLRGKVIILHFWASWCGHCANEMIDLEKFASDLDENELLNTQIVIIPISIDENQAHAEDFYKKKNIKKMPLYIDKNSNYFDKLHLSALPASFIIDPNGHCVKKIKGTINWSNNKVLLKSLKELNE